MINTYSFFYGSNDFTTYAFSQSTVHGFCFFGFSPSSVLLSVLTLLDDFSNHSKTSNPM